MAKVSKKPSDSAAQEEPRDFVWPYGDPASWTMVLLPLIALSLMSDHRGFYLRYWILSLLFAPTNGHLTPTDAAMGFVGFSAALQASRSRAPVGVLRSVMLVGARTFTLAKVQMIYVFAVFLPIWTLYSDGYLAPLWSNPAANSGLPLALVVALTLLLVPATYLVNVIALEESRLALVCLRRGFQYHLAYIAGNSFLLVLVVTLYVLLFLGAPKFPNALSAYAVLTAFSLFVDVVLALRYQQIRAQMNDRGTCLTTG